jgi:hypothetical protein
MPTVFRQDGFRFFFYSNEGDPRESVHIHILAPDGEAKVWLRPIKVARYRGFDFRTLRRICRIVESNRSLIEDAWHEHFGN